jgi:hypothetical protein
MKSSRCIITLGLVSREQVAPGVWENTTRPVEVKATRQRVFQERLDIAYKEGTPINGRFLFRSTVPMKGLDYIQVGPDRYKVRSVTEDLKAHYYTVEAGELF